MKINLIFLILIISICPAFAKEETFIDAEISIQELSHTKYRKRNLPPDEVGITFIITLPI